MKAVCQWKNADKYVTTDKTNEEKRNNINKVWIGNNWWSSGLYKGKRRNNVMPWMNCCVTHIQSHAVKYIAEIKIWHCKHNPGKWHWSNWRLQQTYINKYFKKWTLSMKKKCCCNNMQLLQVWDESHDFQSQHKKFMKKGKLSVISET